MTLYKELRQNKMPFLIGAFIGVYIGVGVIIFANPPEELQEGISQLDFLISKIIISRVILFESIALLLVFTALGIAGAYGFVISRAYKKVAYQFKTVLETNKIRNEFASMILHHIRTPLSGIKWSLKDLIKASDIPPNHREIIRKLADENERSLRAVDHLVAASQASLDRITYEFEIIPLKTLSQLIQDQIDIYESSAKNKNIKIITKLHVASDVFLKIDKDKIIILLATLVENAVTYTPPNGTLTITTEEKENNFILSISDTGIGIPPKDQVRIFSQFFRTEEARRLHPSGFGIGLYLAKSFIESHNGRIWFVSQLGKGTMFSISLPRIFTPTEKFLEKI